MTKHKKPKATHTQHQNLPVSSSQSFNQTTTKSEKTMTPGFQAYSLDKHAHDLVFARKGQDNEVLNQAHKMRSMVAFGLERFWGEQQRLDGVKASYWRDTWSKLTTILKSAGITLPNTVDQLWTFDQEDRKIAIAVLSELCDCMIWWTQRYK
jgi:hypothetical protein